MSDAGERLSESGDVTIQKASPEDADRLAEARYDLRAEISPISEEREQFVVRCTGWMRENLNHERWHCWMAIRSGELVGNVWLEIVEKMPNPAGEPEENAYVTNVFVNESERGRQIGQQLLAVAIDWARTRPIHSLFLWPTARSVPFYKRNGFEFDRMLELNLSGWRSSV